MKRKRLFIVADAGGTKTDWWVWLPELGKKEFFTTSGINASVSTDDAIGNASREFKSRLMEFLSSDFDSSDLEIRFHFYGAGCNSAQSKHRLLQVFSPLFAAGNVEFTLESDIAGAGKALFGDDSGIACILGTGSASGYFNGQTITDSIPSLGYILGDEGSGSFMGKRLLNKLYKRELSENIKEKLERFADVELSGVISKVYREPGANAYLASFVPFLKDNEDEPEISAIIDDCLKLFFERNVLKYDNISSYDIGFVGGLAHAFPYRIARLCSRFGFTPVKIIKSPIYGLANYYQSYE